jgi:hypothetical protein
MHPLPAETRLRELARAVIRNADEMETAAAVLRPGSTAETLMVSHARRLRRLVQLWGRRRRGGPAVMSHLVT